MEGILVIDKPSGMTSHDVVDVVRRKLKVRKVGHAGTLDPMATGVLIILIGKATKLSAKLSGDNKEYEAVMTLGVTTDTGDALGKILNIKNQILKITRKGIERVFGKFRGEIEQIPPMYSAIKYKGKKLYELARQGKEVERKPRRVIIHKLEIKKIALPNVDFEVSCSKGTYIRTLCEDIGKRLGVGAHLSGLRRVRSGKFSIDEAIGLGEL